MVLMMVTNSVKQRYAINVRGSVHDPAISLRDVVLAATPEQARPGAGEAGKGYSVVANEVKELSQETALATQDIARRVETIQTDTTSAVDAIAQVSNVVLQMH